MLNTVVHNHKNRQAGFTLIELVVGIVAADGCYLTYDSFGNPSCTVTLVDTDC